MRLQTLLLVAAPVAVMLLAPVATHAQVVGVKATPKAQPAPPPPQAKIFVKLAVTNVAAVPGETRTLEARLTLGSGDNPVAGKSVAFLIESKDGSSLAGIGEVTGTSGPNINPGSATTNADGKARLPSFKLPVLPAGSYRLRATFAGDDATAATTAEGNLGMVKGITAIDLSNATWNGNTGSVTATLRRTSDNHVVDFSGTASTQAPSLVVTTNGNASPPLGLYAGKLTFSLNAPPSSFQVKVAFMGDPAYQAVEVQRAYSKP